MKNKYLISLANETRFLVQHETCVSVIQNKNGIMMNVGVSVKKWMTGVLVKMIMWNPCTVDCECNKACETDEYLDVKNCFCEKHLIGKSVLKCYCEILNTTEAFIDYKKVTSEKRNCLIHTISLVIICLSLLIDISVRFCNYYTRDWIKKEYVVSYWLNRKWNTINEMNGYIEESNGNTYLNLAPTDKSKEIPKNYEELLSKNIDF